MRLLVILFSTLLIGSACTPYPRYRSGGAERPREATAHRGSARTTNQNLRLGDIIQSYLGRPYKGKSKFEEGVDCSHLTRDVFRKFDKTEIPRMVRDQFKKGKAIARKQLRYGDLVFFRTERDRVSHVGIYVGDDRFAHASTSRGVIISGMKESYWSKRYAGARRIL